MDQLHNVGLLQQLLKAHYVSDSMVVDFRFYLRPERQIYQQLKKQVEDAQQQLRGLPEDQRDSGIDRDLTKLRESLEFRLAIEPDLRWMRNRGDLKGFLGDTFTVDDNGAIRRGNKQYSKNQVEEYYMRENVRIVRGEPSLIPDGVNPIVERLLKEATYAALHPLCKSTKGISESLQKIDAEAVNCELIMPHFPKSIPELQEGSLATEFLEKFGLVVKQGDAYTPTMGNLDLLTTPDVTPNKPIGEPARIIYIPMYRTATVVALYEILSGKTIIQLANEVIGQLPKKK